MPRKPTPTYLKLLSGNPGKRPINDAEPEIKTSIKTMDPPKELGKQAKKLWINSVKEIPDELIKLVDAPELMRYCIAYELYTKAYAEIKKEGAVIKTIDGVKQNPWVVVMNSQAAIMASAGSNLGFSPTSRTKIKIQTDGKKKGKYAELDNLREG